MFQFSHFSRFLPIQPVDCMLKDKDWAWVLFYVGPAATAYLSISSSLLPPPETFSFSLFRYNQFLHFPLSPSMISLLSATHHSSTQTPSQPHILLVWFMRERIRTTQPTYPSPGDEIHRRSLSVFNINFSWWFSEGSTWESNRLSLSPGFEGGGVNRFSSGSILVLSQG